MLHDPGPDEVQAALATAAARTATAGPGSLLLFYYSGHADQDALYPGGRALPLDAVKAQLSADADGRVSMGVIDACFGGGWTGAKGLVPEAPFEVPPPEASEGLVFIASSSGDEAAHEAQAVGGSFFTRNLVAGLRGAADFDTDGQISLREAFDYAKRGTARDAVLYAEKAQTPSFDVHLRGRQDLVLTQLDRAPSTMVLGQDTGPMEVVHVASGVTVVTLEPGERSVTIALPPGAYIVRRRQGGEVFSTEVDLAAGRVVQIDEQSLELRGAPALVAKGGDRLHQPTRSLLPRGQGEIRAFVSTFLNPGIAPARTTDFTLSLGGGIGLSDRVHLVLPAVVAGRLTPSADHAWIVGGGLTDFAQYSGFTGGADVYRFSSTTLRVAAFAETRHTLAERRSAGATLAAGIRPTWGTWEDPAVNAIPTYVDVGLHLVWSEGLGRHVTVQVPLGFHIEGPPDQKGFTIDLATNYRRSGRPVPLLQFHVHPRVTLDVNWRIGVLYADANQVANQLNLGQPLRRLWLGTNVSL